VAEAGVQRRLRRGPDGSITHPLFRAVKVAGVPFTTAEANLRKFLSAFEDNP